MNFDIVSYPFLLQDFACAMGAGAVAAFADRLLAVFLWGGKKRVFVRDMLSAFVFAVAVFSFTVSFANYPDVRIYHIIGAALGFLSFNVDFSTFFHKIFKKIFSAVKNNILCCGKKMCSTICALTQKVNQKQLKRQETAEKNDLKTKEVWVYNL